ncbi:SusD/RagB family nutrient-binding outer membrane lipoprotein [Sphingobacterium corticibacter]|uniref:SusD/RagB family nutrient-binding outer membrane lipoprotein n=1 Tax=Sphingobacterium corticibacter TaxID=2171749 RepID=A0A2T8HMP6_9SPHI|nr:SusD/RagB family nutrient-binding outer membrane lipoprotein [Sphingobacterium corticibacter]PVH26714.1 SusD/RagB family nutrient-binding outer membrane lipoprotein [Sphingobacterium corticibacter]
MKKIIYMLLGASILFSETSCTSEFDELNIDPNRIEQVTPGSLVTPTIYGMSNYFTVRSYDFTWQIMQVGLPNPSVQLGVHRYDLTPGAGNGTWNTCYSWLRNVREMREAADASGQPAYLAVASTLQAYIGGILTDAFGDVPFSEALRAEEGVSQPKFDTQEEIYAKMIADLEEANTIYSGEGTMSGNDVLFNNDKTKWRKFNNSLLLRLLLRTSKRTEMDSYNRIRQILADPTTYPIFTSNAEAALLTVTGLAPYNYAWARRQDYVNFEAMSSFFVDMLNDLEDPRRPLFMTQASRLVDGKQETIGYKGIPSAHSGDESQFDYAPSTPNGNLMIYDAIGTPITQVIMSYAEVEFIKAEVALHFQQLDLAKEAYERGVSAALTQWPGSTMPADYFSNPAAAFDGTLEQVLNQKYLALFFNDYQQWYEHRRTGYPVLPKTEFMVNDGIMPSRFMYHNDVQRFNPDNYREVVDRIGEDGFNTKVWWER